MSDDPTRPSVLLSPEQARRADALRVARDVFSSYRSAASPGAYAIYVVDIAEWILTGDTSHNPKETA